MTLTHACASVVSFRRRQQFAEMEVFTLNMYLSHYCFLLSSTVNWSLFCAITYFSCITGRFSCFAVFEHIMSFFQLFLSLYIFKGHWDRKCVATPTVICNSEIHMVLFNSKIQSIQVAFKNASTVFANSLTLISVQYIVPQGVWMRLPDCSMLVPLW